MRQVPYGHQSIDKDDIREVVAVLKSDFITQGPKVKEFEDALCRYAGAKYAVAVSSGTAALHIACLAAGVSKGDEVITSSITFVASANCALYCGARPVFADIEPDTANLEPAEVRRNITRRTKAVIPVHFAGHPCNLEKIYELAKIHNLTVIEDAAHALGARYKGLPIGCLKYSDMAVFSFHPVKSLTTGEGGAVLTNRKVLYERLLMFRNHGITKDKSRMRKIDGPWYYEMQELGFNYRITDIQCALGISQLKRLNEFVKARRKIAETYDGAFRDSPFFDIPIEKDYAYSAYHLYPIRLKNRFKSRKKDIFTGLRRLGIGTQVHYIPVYRHPYYQKIGFVKKICPNAEDYYSRAISIPIYSALQKNQVKHVIRSIFKVFNESG